MEFNKISLEISDNIGIMRFNDPTVRNAVSGEMLEGLWECLNEVEKRLKYTMPSNHRRR